MGVILGPDGRPLGPSPQALEEARERADREQELRRDSRVRGTADTLKRKMEPGDWVACFECHALDSQYAGERMLLIYGGADYDAFKVGSSAPDTKSFGTGWKFRLVEKLRDPLEAAAWLYHREVPR